MYLSPHWSEQGGEWRRQVWSYRPPPEATLLPVPPVIRRISAFRIAGSGPSWTPTPSISPHKSVELIKAGAKITSAQSVTPSKSTASHWPTPALTSPPPPPASPPSPTSTERGPTPPQPANLSILVIDRNSCFRTKRLHFKTVSSVFLVLATVRD